MGIRESICLGKTLLGIEFGSTRIKAVLIDEHHTPIASGSYEWENQYEAGIWTYSLEAVWQGLQSCYTRLAQEVKDRYDIVLETVGAIGFSAMMHGYMAFDEQGELLVPFRTWRNTITEEASKQLTDLFKYHIPERWSIAHLYQAILNKESHVSKLSFLTTLAGYVHWQLTGEKVLGIGDASGMFPIDEKTRDYDMHKVGAFNELIAPCGYRWQLQDVLPKVLLAGELAGTLTEEGARRLDVSGNLKAGIKVCPPEGDAGTGMIATNSIAIKTGNVSAGTSIFAMIVLEKELKKVYPEIDLVTTPVGDLVAMVHCNNCTSDLNAWMHLFKELVSSLGIDIEMSELFTGLYQKALEGDEDCGGLLAYNYVSGESITGFEEGRPLFTRLPDSHFSLANFMRVHLFTTVGALKNGLDLLLKEEGVQISHMLGHGGLFKTPVVGQRIMAAAMNTPITVMTSAGEGGPWGMALLAAYMLYKEERQSLEDYLNEKVFNEQEGTTILPDPKDVEGFNRFMKQYNKGLIIERAAVEAFK